ncbi:hypothetical protein ABPG74_005170 [Tetrahymena malaccensis]
MIGLLYLLINITSIIMVKSQCYLGCKNCDLDSNTYSYSCQSCNQNFQYVQTLSNCLYQECKQNMLLQIDNNQQSQCVSICEDNSTSLNSLNQCIKTRMCSQNFNTQATFSNNQKVLDLFQYQQQYYLVKYNGFLNIINSESGQYTLSVQLDTTTILCEFIFGQLILVKQNNYLYQFILENQQQIQLSQIPQGTINSSSTIKGILQNLLIITSTEQNSQNLFINVFRFQDNTIQFVKVISIQNQNQKAYFLESKVIFITQNVIKIYEVQDNLDTVTLKQLSDNIVCQSIANSLILNILTSPDQLFYYIFIQNSQSFYKYSLNQNNCSQVNLMGNIINLIKVDSLVNQLLIYQFNASLQIQQIDQQMISQISISQNIADIQYYLQGEFIYLIILTVDNKISLYQSGLVINSTTNLLSQINLKILNPSKLKLFADQNNQKNLFVAGNDFELIKINVLNQMQKVSVTQAFSSQILSNQSQINKVYFDSVTQLLYSCSSEGQIIIWNSMSSYDLLFYKSFYFNQDSCRDFIVFKNYYLAVLLSNSIQVFDLQQQQQQTFSNQNQQIAAYTLQSSLKYLLIALGNCVNILADQIQIVLSYCSNQYQTVIKHILINDNQLITVSQNQVFLSNIDFDLKQISIIKTLNFQFQLVTFIKNESQLNSVIVFDQKQYQFVVFDYNLNILDQHTLNQVSQLIDVNTIVDDSFQNKYRYFFTYICNLPQLTYKYCVSTMLQGQTQVLLLRNIIQVSNIITSFKYTTLNNQLIYKVIVNSSVSTTQIQVQIKWNYNTNLSNFDNLFYLRNEVSTCDYYNQQNQQVYQGHQSGFLGLNIAYIKQGFYFYQNPQGSSDIQKIQQIYDIGKIFIIKKTLLVYDIAQQLFIEEIKIDDDGDQSIDYIQEFKYNKKLKIVTCFKRQNFFILAYSQNTKTKINLNNIQQISNYYLQENQQIIYIYGTNISKYDIPSQQLQVIYTPDSYIITSCTFSTQVFACQTNPQKITIFNNTDNSVIKTITSLDFQDLSILKIDQLYNNILIYKTSIFSYSIPTKELIQVMKQNQFISSLNIYNSKIVVFTSNSIFIYSRVNIQLLAQFQIYGNYVNSIYLDDYNNIIYHTDDVSKGQLQQISLDSLTQLPSISDYYSQTIPRTVFYDKDNSFLSFTDNQGYLQVYQYSRKTLDTPVYFEEFNGNSYLDISIDYKTGNLIIYNQQYAYILNYNNLISTYIRPYQPIPYKYVISKNIFIVASSNNVLYNYSNQNFSYLTEFDDQLLGIYQSQNFNAIIIFFNNYFLIYQNVVGAISNKNYSNKVSNISIRQFLDDDVFVTVGQQIIHYSYQQNRILYQFQIQEAEILKQYYTNQKQQIILLGYSTGKVQAYNKITYELYTVFQQINQSVINFQSYQNQIWITFQYGVLVTFTYEQILLKNQTPMNNIDLLEISNAKQNLQVNYLELKQIYIDELYNQFYIHFNHFKQIYTIQIKDFTVECKMLFPHNRLNTLLISNMYIILQTSCQLNFHLRSTQQFIFFIKDDFRRQQQYQTIIVDDNIVVVIFLQKINIYQINQNIPLFDTNNNDYFKLIDSQILLYPQVMQYNFNTTTQTLQIVGFSSNGIFDYLYDVTVNPNLMQNQCISVIKVQNPFQFQKQLLFQQPSSRLSQTYYIYIKDNLNILNLVNQQANQIIIQPQDNEVIQLDTQSLSYFQFQAFVKQFNFYFRDLGVYSFSNSVQQINIENSSILKQNIQGKTLLFKSKNIVIINQLIIDGIFDSQNKQEQAAAYIHTDSFITFQNCSQIFIYNLQIRNLNIQSLTAVLILQEIDNVYIDNLIIEQNTISKYIIQFIAVKNLIISNIQVKNNIQNQFLGQQIIQLSGCLLATIKDAQFDSNQNIQFLSAFNYFEDQTIKINLTNDILNLQNFQLVKNLYIQIDQSYVNQIRIQNIPMIYIQSNYANINNFTSTLNNMNIVFNQSQQINLQDSSFSDNTALEGGALYFQNIQDQIQLKNTTFKNNVAYANGGAIFFDGIKNIFLDQLTSIKQNTALIGGGIRIKGVQNFQLINKGIVDQNKAEIFGDNIATYPSQVQIQSFSQQKEQFSFKSDINLKKIWIDNFKSGGSLDFDIFFMDDNGKHLNFSTNSLKQGIYPKIIQNEIQYWNAHLIVFNTSFVQLVGESSVNYNSFNETTKSFPFKTLYINSLPQTTQFLTLQYQLVDYIQPNQISIEINFRNCKAGEVDHILNDQIRSCLSCDVGHYSMYNYSQSYNQSEIICKQCPQQSQSYSQLNYCFDHFYFYDYHVPFPLNLIYSVKLKFILKMQCLMNYLQIQLILIGQIDQIPQFISFLPNTIGQPSSITTIGSLCLVPSEQCFGKSISINFVQDTKPEKF